MFLDSLFRKLRTTQIDTRHLLREEWNTKKYGLPAKMELNFRDGLSTRKIIAKIRKLWYFSTRMREILD
jgi:hypothetical protein